MSNENFEKYLSLLKGFLKFDSQQQEEIANELRDHLEHRIEQLTGEGMSAEEAELIAIQEFGDAAGMANSFLNVSRLYRQRWIMRFTTFAIVGSFVVALFVMSMWPENGPVRLATSQAQGLGSDFRKAKVVPGRQIKRQASSRKDSLETVSRTRSVAEERAIVALNSEIKEFKVAGLPLKEAINMLSETANVPIIISRRYLDDMGIDDGHEVSLSIAQAKLTTILEMLLDDQCGLDDWAYGVKDSVIFVAGEDSIDQLMEVRVYDCKDFAIEALVTAPIGGFGGGFGGGMGGGGIGGGGGGFFCVPSNQGLVPQTRGNRAAGSPGLRTQGNQNAANQNTANQKPSIQPGTSLAAGGGTPGANPSAKQTSPPGMAAGGGDQMGAGDMGAGGGMGAGGMGSDAGGGSGGMGLGYKTYKVQDLDELIDCIKQTVDTDSWETMGGVATLNQVGSVLVVKQSIKNHDRLEELLKMLRKANK